VSTDIFDAIVWLDPPLCVSRRVSRGPYDVQIAGKPTRLWLPLKGPSELRFSRSAPVVGIPDFPPPRLARPITHGLWTGIGMSARLRQRPLIVEAFRMRWRDPDRARTEGEPFPPSFDADVGPWLSVVRDWLSAWRHDVLRPMGEETTPSVRVARLGGEAVTGGGGNAAFGVYFGNRPLSTPSQFRAAFAAASAGRELPTEHSLYGEALAYAASRRYREAVISACSAAEVALLGCADDLLAKAGYDEKERVDLAQVTGVIDLYRVCASRRGGLPVSLGTVKHRLAGPRNAAAHKGRVPDEETVREAINTARDILAISLLPSASSLFRSLDQPGADTLAGR
jgi:hypothetical protein